MQKIKAKTNKKYLENNKHLFINSKIHHQAKIQATIDDMSLKTFVEKAIQEKL